MRVPSSALKIQAKKNKSFFRLKTTLKKTLETVPINAKFAVN